MRIFRRRRSAPAPASDALPMLDARGAERLERLLREELGARGIETVHDPGNDTLRAADGSQYSLWNLTCICAELPESQWPDVVSDHVERMLAEEPATALPEQLFLRLVHSTALDGPPPTTAMPVADDLFALPAIDLPQRVDILTEPAALEPFGGVEAAHRLALANLRRLRSAKVVPADQGDPAATVHLVYGEDYFAASRLLVLPEVLHNDLGAVQAPHGVLVAVPHRHLLAVHVLAGPGVVTAMNSLIALARGGFDTAPGPVSPHVYWSDGHRVERVTESDDRGSSRVLVWGGLSDAFIALDLAR